MKRSNMSILTKILDAYPEDGFLKADGFDGAILGVDTAGGRLVYSVSKCIDILIEEQGMSYEDAVEHFDYNVSGSYVGEQTPIWVTDNFNL